MKTLKIIFFLLLIPLAPIHAQSDASKNTQLPEVEWYPPEIEKVRNPDRAKVIISGRTLPNSLVQIDGESVNIIKAKPTQTAPPPPEEVERQLRANCKAYESPELNAKPISTFQKGSKVRTMDHSSSWVKVAVGRGVGYVSLPCFHPVKKSQPSTPPPAAAEGPTIENQETRANAEGFFEIAIELPTGLAQIPILVTSPAKVEKSFLISVDVSVKKDNIKMNTKISNNKPPAAGKKIRIWAGLGGTYQTYKQSSSNGSDLGFSTMQAPGILGRVGYWGDQFGFDFYFRDAPGKIEAEPSYGIESATYHWQTIEAKGLYQFNRGPTSRLMGLPSQWQLRFGAQVHQIPFLSFEPSGVKIQDANVTTATLGTGLLLGQEQLWSYEFGLGLQIPISASGPSGYKVSSAVGLEAQIGAGYKFAPNWRLGIFSYIQSHSYSYESQNQLGAVQTGKQNLFYTTFDLRLGYEY